MLGLSHFWGCWKCDSEGLFLSDACLQPSSRAFYGSKYTAWQQRCLCPCRFIARLPEAREKAEEYANIGMLTEAANAAAQSKDTDMLATIQGMVGGTSNPLGAAVSQLKDRLQGAAGVSR